MTEPLLKAKLESCQCSKLHLIPYSHHQSIACTGHSVQSRANEGHISDPLIMAAAASSAPLDPLLGRAVDFVRPDFHQVNLDVETYLKNERGFKLDSGESTLLGRGVHLASLFDRCLNGPLAVSSPHHQTHDKH